jgi:hypothetical protein
MIPQEKVQRQQRLIETIVWIRNEVHRDIAFCALPLIPFDHRPQPTIGPRSSEDNSYAEATKVAIKSSIVHRDKVATDRLIDEMGEKQRQDNLCVSKQTAPKKTIGIANNRHSFPSTASKLSSYIQKRNDSRRVFAE